MPTNNRLARPEILPGLNTLACYENTALKSFKTLCPGLEHRAMKDTNLFGYFIPKGKTKNID
jgi:hypothetical protein